MQMRMNDIPFQPEASSAKPKMTPIQWTEVRLRAEAGEPYEAIAALYPVTAGTIKHEAHSQKWLTPARIQRGVRGELKPDDPAQAAANLWVIRKEQARESVFHGARKMVERGFAMAPVPQTVGELALAVKLMNEAISPPEENHSTVNMNLAVLTSVGFTPKVQD